MRCYLALMKTGLNAVGGCDRPVESVAGDGLAAPTLSWTD